MAQNVDPINSSRVNGVVKEGDGVTSAAKQPQSTSKRLNLFLQYFPDLCWNFGY